MMIEQRIDDRFKEDMDPRHASWGGADLALASTSLKEGLPRDALTDATLSDGANVLRRAVKEEAHHCDIVATEKVHI